MALSKWIAQLPPVEKWSERKGTHYAVEIWNESGEHVATVYGQTEREAEQRTLRMERRTPIKEQERDAVAA